MPTTTIQVAAVTAPDTWTLGAGADKVVAVNSPDDDDISYIFGTVAGNQEQYSLAAHAIPAGSTINSVSTSSRVKNIAGAFVTVRVYLGADFQTGPFRSPSAYTTYVDSFSRPGGGTWQLSDITSLQIAVRYAAAGGAIHCTSLWLIVDYTPPSSFLAMFD